MNNPALNNQPDRLISALEAITIPVWIFDIDYSRIYWANTLALSLWNATSLDELRQRDMSRDMSPSVSQRLRQFQEGFRQGKVFDEPWTLYPKNQPQTFHCKFSGINTEDGRVAMLCQALETDQHDPETLHGLQALLLTSVMVSLYDDEGSIVYSNPAAQTMLGNFDHSLEEHFVDKKEYQNMREIISEVGEYRGEAQVYTADDKVWHEINVQCGPDAVTGKNAYLVNETNITERRIAQEHANRLAYHDTLTNLPNRANLVEKLEQELKLAQRYHHTFALLFLDLDRFKSINDTLGHTVGDDLLVQVGNAIETAIYETDMAARLGGDEFVCILRELTNADAAAITARRIIEKITRPFSLGTHHLYVTPSIGISVFPEDGSTVTELMQHADIAMYQAKARGGNEFVFFDKKMNDQAKSRLALESDLRSAIQRQEFILHFQPQINIRTNQIVGVEALVRWQHPERGVLGPAMFIGVAEDTGMLSEIDDWVLNQAARQQVVWSDAGYPIKVAINVSAKQFKSGNLLEKIKHALQKTNCQASQLELEITESVFMGSEKSVLLLLRELRDMGLTLSIDDFGTGYSNLAYLQNFPINNLKIDQSFVNKMEMPAILELIISLGKLLKVKLIAEGVENRKQLDWLSHRGCHEYQGYYFSKPVDADSLLNLLAKASSSN